MSYTPVIPGRIALVSGQNVSGPRAAQTAGGLASTFRGGTDMAENTPSTREHEARVRLRAIGQWVTHAEAGECTVEAAVEACVELAAAADRFLSEPEAA